MFTVRLLTAADLEKVMVAVGAVRLNDQRLQHTKEHDAGASSTKIRQGTTGGDEDDSDWD